MFLVIMHVQTLLISNAQSLWCFNLIVDPWSTQTGTLSFHFCVFTLSCALTSQLNVLSTIQKDCSILHPTLQETTFAAVWQWLGTEFHHPPASASPCWVRYDGSLIILVSVAEAPKFPRNWKSCPTMRNCLSFVIHQRERKLTMAGGDFSRVVQLAWS